jgi:hypothetical protein
MTLGNMIFDSIFLILVLPSLDYPLYLLPVSERNSHFKLVIQGMANRRRLRWVKAWAL